MTCREKLKMEHPEDFDNGGPIRCPSDYGYLNDPVDETGRRCCHPMTCSDCWDREIPEERSVYDICKEIRENPNAKKVTVEFPAVQKVIEEVSSNPHIKDSGDRTEFSSGAVRDMHEGKGRMDLLPWAAIMEVSKHCENGAKKYGEHNVDRGIPTSSLCDSAARHLAKYLDGWTDEPHLIAATWNLLWAIQMEVKNEDMVNTPWKKREDITDMLQG